MGQKLFDDKIGNLTHAGGTITLAPSIITIGGQQYRTTSPLSRPIVSDVVLAANSLYMVFVVLVSGVVELRISTNVNSVGPSGFAAWKLVGAFYSNNGPMTFAFGSFVNIKGTPETNTVNAGPLVFDATIAAPTKGTTVVDRTEWVRRGENMYFRADYRQRTAGTAGNGIYMILFPSGILADLNKVYYGGSVNTARGKSQFTGNKTISSGHPYMVESDRVRIVGDSDVDPGNPWSSTFQPLSNINSDVSMFVEVPVVGWDNRSIEDL